MARRITRSSINWIELEKRVPPEQKTKFYAFKAKSDTYLRRMLSNPEQPPKINWEEYKKTVPVTGLVDKFMAEYNALKVPYPEDRFSQAVDTQWASLEPEINKYCDEQKQNIARAQKEIDRVKALPDFEDMTMEMLYDMHPDQALDCVNRPSFWPHLEDEQLGYKDPTQKA